MDKLAQHYAANAFVDEIEKIAGYALSDDEREFLYKEAMLNIGQIAAKGKQLMQAGAAMAKNPAAAASQLTHKAQMAAMKAQTSPAFGQALQNPAMFSAMAGGSALGAAQNVITGGAARMGLGAVGQAVPKMQGVTNTLGSAMDAIV